MSSEKQNVEVSDGPADQRFTVNNNDRTASTNENNIEVKILERRLTYRKVKKISIVVETVEDRIQGAIFATMGKLIAPGIDLGARSMNLSSVRDAASVTANSERGSLPLLRAYPTETVHFAN